MEVSQAKYMIGKIRGPPFPRSTIENTFREKYSFAKTDYSKRHTEKTQIYGTQNVAKLRYEEILKYIRGLNTSDQYRRLQADDWQLHWGDSKSLYTKPHKRILQTLRKDTCTDRKGKFSKRHLDQSHWPQTRASVWFSVCLFIYLFIQLTDQIATCESCMLQTLHTIMRKLYAIDSAQTATCESCML